VDYSITLSVRSSTDCGMVRPGALAVLPLMNNSNVVICSDRQVAGLGALQDLVYIGGRAPELLGEIWPVAHQTAGLYIFPNK
jgi:hypothetical protein